MKRIVGCPNSACCLLWGRAEDTALATLSELALVLVYLCALVVKACEASPAACSLYGFGEEPKGATELSHERICRPATLMRMFSDRHLPLLPLL